MYSEMDTLAGGFPHSDTSGSKLVSQLPKKFRRPPRPSSPVIAKAFTICTYSLDPITLKPKPFSTYVFPHETVIIVSSKAYFKNSFYLNIKFRCKVLI